MLSYSKSCVIELTVKTSLNRFNGRLWSALFRLSLGLVATPSLWLDFFVHRQLIVRIESADANERLIGRICCDISFRFIVSNAKILPQSNLGTFALLFEMICQRESVVALIADANLN